MSRHNRWPPPSKPVIEKVVPGNQWDYQRYCWDCGKMTRVYYFMHPHGRWSGTAWPLCNDCGEAKYTVQELDKLVNRGG